jgi:hypothetical protein
MGEWRYSSTILDHNTRCRWVVRSTPWPLYPRYAIDRSLGVLQSRSGSCGEKSCTCGNRNPAVRPVSGRCTDWSVNIFIYLTHHWQTSHFWVIGFFRRLLQIWPGFHFVDFSTIYFYRARSSALRQTPNIEGQAVAFTPPSDRVAQLLPPGTGFPFRRLLRLAGLRWNSNPPAGRKSTQIRSLKRSSVNGLLCIFFLELQCLIRRTYYPVTLLPQHMFRLYAATIRCLLSC